MLRLFELGTRPHEAKTKEEAMRIARYEEFCHAAAARAEVQEARYLIARRK